MYHYILCNLLLLFGWIMWKGVSMGHQVNWPWGSRPLPTLLVYKMPAFVMAIDVVLKNLVYFILAET